MFALLRQLSKLLLLVFNLPQTLSILTNLFKVSPGPDGKLRLGIVDTIAKAVVAQEVDSLKQQVELGKENDRKEVESETTQLKSIYSKLTDEPTKQYFLKQAEIRKVKRMEQIDKRSADGMINEAVVNRMVQERAKQLEPAIVPALAPITALLGIPVFLTKLSEYVSQAAGLAGSITSKETADNRADAYTSEFDDGGGDVFNGVITGEGMLEVSFFGIDNNEDFKLFSTITSDDKVTLKVTDESLVLPLQGANIIDYGLLNRSEEIVRNTFKFNIVNDTVVLSIPKTPDIPKMFQKAFSDKYGFDKDTEIIIRIADNKGSFADIKLPTEISFDAGPN